MRLPLAALLALTLACSSCGSSPAQENGPTDADIAGAKASASPAGPVVLKVGQTYHYPGGLALRVDAFRLVPKSVLSPATYDKPKTWKGLVVDVTLKNGTHAVHQADGASALVTSGPNDAQGDYVGIAAGGIAWSGDTPLLPGKVRKAAPRFLVPSGKGITLTITPGTDLPEVVFTGDAR